ncbi:TRAF3-interacting protein 1-like [Microplitis mediator]|uniref:TRAF3-interacting protein 1-like n=1 Tax=Microplitis mediator TaxID=375433 RepID=UPI002557A6B2|nr:TRAF3-interacting protein 1-like [Microplitis mediator]
MPRQMYALVKWVDSGDSKNKYTPDIPIEWIKGFEPDKFNPKKINLEDSYVIEWRDSKHEPREGWKSYDGLVIDISSRKSTLEKKLDDIAGQLSPRRVTSDKARSPSRERDSHRSDRHKNKRHEREKEAVENDRKKAKNDDRDRDRIVQSVGSNSKVSTPQLQPYIRNLDLSKSYDSEASSSRLANGAQSSSFTGSIQPLLNNRSSGLHNGSNQELLNVIEELKEKVNKIEKLYDTAIKQPSRPTTNTKSLLRNGEPVESGELNYARPLSMDLIEIGHQGSGVTISTDAWDTAKSKTTFTAMGITLLMAIFDTEILLTSNVKGGKSKIKSDSTRMEALDATRLNALKHTVRRMFAKSYNDRRMNEAINTKLSTLRRIYRQKHAKAQERIYSDDD